MAVMNHVLHSRVIPASAYRIYTGLPFIKDPQLRRQFRNGRLASPTMVDLHTSSHRWADDEDEPQNSHPRHHFARTLSPKSLGAPKCANCTAWMEVWLSVRGRAVVSCRVPVSVHGGVSLSGK